MNGVGRNMFQLAPIQGKLQLKGKNQAASTYFA